MDLSTLLSELNTPLQQIIFDMILLFIVSKSYHFITVVTGFHVDLLKGCFWKCPILHSDVTLLYPLNWLFANTFWKSYMKRVLENIRKLTANS